MDNGGRSGDDVPQVQRKAEELTAGVHDQLEGLRGYAEDAAEWVRDFARERPVAAVAIAAGLGFFVGRILSRR